MKKFILLLLVLIIGAFLAELKVPGLYLLWPYLVGMLVGFVVVWIDPDGARG